jgi:hypothetical protein
VSGKPIVLNLIIALRPGQWTKNLLVFAGLIFGMQLFVPSAVIRAIAAFVIFCGLSGAVYLVNDIADRESDRQHPLKAQRPIASCALAVPTAWTVALPLGGAASAILGWRFTAVAASPSLQALYQAPEAHRHHRRADAFKLRPARDRRSGRGSTFRSATGCRCVRSSWRCSSRSPSV